MLVLRSFKLRIADGHARAVPKTDARGCPFSGPGVDLRGVEAQAAFDAAKPLFDALLEVEPGVTLRSLSVDFERPRVLCTLEPTVPAADRRPRVVRIDDGPLLQRLLRKTEAVEAVLCKASARALAARKE